MSASNTVIDTLLIRLHTEHLIQTSCASCVKFLRSYYTQKLMRNVAALAVFNTI